MSDASIDSGRNKDANGPETEPTWKEVLEFVRDQTDKEVKGIERLFDRAVKYFGWLVLATAIIAGFFGFSTYTSLRDQISAATNAEEVKANLALSEKINKFSNEEAQKADLALSRKIDEFSKRENLEALVKQHLREETDAELKKLVAENVSKRVNSALPAIIANAQEETKRQLAKSFAPREISPELRSRIEKALSPYSGTLYHVESGYQPDAETVQFANTISAILKTAGWIEDERYGSLNNLRYDYVKKRSGGSYGSRELGVFWTPPGLIVAAKDIPAGKALKAVFAPIITSADDTSELVRAPIPAGELVDVWLIVGSRLMSGSPPPHSD
jgi:hypothetical protein